MREDCNRRVRVVSLVMSRVGKWIGCATWLVAGCTGLVKYCWTVVCVSIDEGRDDLCGMEWYWLVDDRSPMIDVRFLCE